MSCKFDMVTVTRRARRAEGGKGGHIGLVEKPRHVEVRERSHISRENHFTVRLTLLYFLLYDIKSEKNWFTSWCS